MFIDSRELNEYLGKTFFPEGLFRQDLFTGSITYLIDNDAHFSAMAEDDRILARSLAFWAFRRLAEQMTSHYRHRPTEVSLDQLQNWTEAVEFVENLDPMQPVIDHINALRNNEKETDTMNTEINSTNITIDNEKEEDSMENIITCAECGRIIENENYAHEVDGEWYCDDCFNEKYVICEECGEIIERDDAEEYDGEYYCDDCFHENFAICARCGEAHPTDEMTEIDDEWYCEDCRDDRFTQCERCGEWVRNYDIYSVHVDEDGSVEDWCQHCLEYHTWTCEECEESWSDDVSYEYDENDDCICPVCYENVQRHQEDGGDIDNWRAPRGIQSYHYKPNPCFCNVEAEKGCENLVRYGYELEVDKGGESDSMADFVNDTLRYTYCKHDGSLHDGFEIVSHPATLAYHMSKKGDLERAFEQLVAEGYRSHEANTCGLHVHISKAAVEAQNPNAVNNMLFIMDHFWSRLVKFSRRTESQLNSWARRYSRLHGDYETWKEQAKDTRDRYYALNLQNTHTVEIRMFRGTLKLNTFLATLQFVDVLTKKCIEITDLRELQALSWQELVKNDYEELNSYLKERGLYGSDADIEAAEEEERRRREEKEAKERAEEEERRRRVEECIRERERDFEDFRNRYVNHRVRIISSPDGFNDLVGHEGTVVYVNSASPLPVIVDFIDELPEGFRDSRGIRVLHGTDIVSDHSHMRVFWNCPLESVALVDESPRRIDEAINNALDEDFA